MTCELAICLPVPEVASLLTSSSAMNQLSPSNGTPTPAVSCESEQKKAGSQACACGKAMSGCSIHPHTRDEWIASQRASLAKIFQQQVKARELRAQEADLSAKYSEQLMLFDRASSSLKTAHASEPGDGMWLLGNFWRVDTPGATESLARLMSVRPIKGIDGGALLPTLTVCGNWNRKGASKTSGDGLITRLKMMPTLCARDARTVAGAQPPKRAQTSGLPLAWSLGKDLEPIARRGLRLSPMWAAWYMGWPMTWFQERSKPSVMGKSHCKPHPPGSRLEGQ